MSVQERSQQFIQTLLLDYERMQKEAVRMARYRRDSIITHYSDEAFDRLASSVQRQEFLARREEHRREMIDYAEDAAHWKVQARLYRRQLGSVA